MSFKTIQRKQQKDKELLQKACDAPKDYAVHSFRGGGKSRSLIMCKGLIYAPPVLRKRLMHWHHTQLCHPGTEHAYLTIGQHFAWPKMQDTIERICGACPTCQKAKRHKKKYGHLPEKAEVELTL